MLVASTMTAALVDKADWGQQDQVIQQRAVHCGLFCHMETVCLLHNCHSVHVQMSCDDRRCLKSYNFIIQTFTTIQAARGCCIFVSQFLHFRPTTRVAGFFFLSSGPICKFDRSQSRPQQIQNDYLCNLNYIMYNSTNVIPSSIL